MVRWVAATALAIPRTGETRAVAEHSAPSAAPEGPMTLRIWIVIVVSVLAILAAWLLPPMPQPLDYHDFADHREILGVENFLDVTSNLAFAVVAGAGLWVTLGRRARFQSSVERWPYAIFFLGVLLTAAGSAYYHLAPDNETLFWDRLPMTVGFMALVSSQIVDRINVRAGILLLIPMLVLGAASVVYWRATERAGAGNVLPYGILQAYSMVIVLFMAVLVPSRYSKGNYLYWVFAWYALSKLLETFDTEVMGLGHMVSGHTLKHLAAAVAPAVVCLMLLRRTPMDTGLEHRSEPVPPAQGHLGRVTR
jgi:hypothetical protein